MDMQLKKKVFFQKTLKLLSYQIFKINFLIVPYLFKSKKELEWYNSEEYKPIKQIRLDNSEGTNIVIKGI